VLSQLSQRKKGEKSGNGSTEKKGVGGRHFQKQGGKKDWGVAYPSKGGKRAHNEPHTKDSQGVGRLPSTKKTTGATQGPDVAG